MLRLIDLTLSFGERVLFDGLDWHIKPGRRIGVVGDNGVGKTTLLHIMVGRQEPDHGRVQLTKGRRIGHLRQDVTFSATHSVLEQVLEGAGEVRQLELKLHEAQDRLGTLEPDGDEFTTTLEEVHRLQERYEQLDGFRLESEARRILSGLGFTDAQMSQGMEEFSGGWQMRVALAGLLLQKPDLLLLDEPTNHLDTDTVEWLERFLKTYPGTLLVVSHDRFFLDRCVSEIAELTASGLRIWPGNWSQYRELKAQEREQLEAAQVRQSKDLAKTERFIERFRAKATKSKQVQSRVKALEKVERIEIEEEAATFSFRFPAGRRAGEHILRLEGAGQRYGDFQVFRDLDLSIERGERVALVGPNGAGKSTLMRLVAGLEEPTHGVRKWGHQVDVAIYTQESERALDASNTVLEELAAGVSGFTERELRSLAGAFRYPGNDVQKPVGVLSGGEKSRLAVAKLLLRSANFLVLDEPTNHLDVKAKDVLQRALSAFEGTVLVVSHDRYFLDGVVDRVLEMREGRLHDYAGTYSDFLWQRERRDAEASSSASTSSNSSSRLAKGTVPGAGPKSREDKRAAHEERQERRRRRRKLEKDVARFEREMAEVEATITSLEAELVDETIYQDAPRLERATRAHKEARDRLEVVMESWETAQLALDEASSDEE